VVVCDKYYGIGLDVENSVWVKTAQESLCYLQSGLRWLKTVSSAFQYRSTGAVSCTGAPVHRYSRGYGFESGSGLKFFSGFNFTTA